MIKDSMNLPLGINTQYIKSTGGVFTTATDAEILPYTIGYIPFSMLDKARIFKNVGKYTNTSVPNVSFRTIRQNTLYEPTKGVPFVYTVKTILENQNFHGFYDTTGNVWNTSFIGHSNTNLRVLHSYDTNHFVNDSGNNGLNVTGLRLTFILFETLGNGGWGGTSPQTVADKNRVSVSATFSEVTPDIVLSFSASVSSSFGSHTYTIDNSIFNAMDENGVFQIDGGTYSSGGTDFERHLFGVIEQIYVETSGHNLSTNSPGFGAVIAENFRNTQTLTEQNHTNVRNTYGTQSTNYLVSANECMYLFDSKSGYFWEYALNDVSLFRFAVADWINCPVFCGATWSDVLICICTALPAYKINNVWYVAEFTDDYYITGKLIPYAQARDWQKNINGDTNVFDPADIPEPGPGPEDEPDAYGADSIPDLNFSAGAISDFVTMYCLTEQQVSAFGAYLWANIFSTDFLRSIGTMVVNDFSINPADILNYIISLRKYPFDLYGKNGYDPIASGSLYFGRGVAGIPISGSFGKMQNLAGTFGGEYIEIPSKYKDFRDYEPYTRITVFVPFCGSIELTPSEVVGKRIFITYTVDYSTGNVQADVWVSSDVSFIVGTVTGQIGATVQTTASNNMEVLQKVASTAANFVKVATSVAAIAATGGAAAESAMTGEISGAEATAKELGALSSTVDVTTGALANAPVVSSNPIHASSVGSGFASFATPRARLIVERRKYQKPSNYNHVYGQATNVTVTLSDLEGKGFTVCKNVDLSGIPATQDELSAIESLLRSGVYF